MIPDLSDDQKMARQGRLSALYKARKETADKARDHVARMLANVESSDQWDIDRLTELLEEVRALTVMMKDQ
jgi:hypothetical protein